MATTLPDGGVLAATRGRPAPERIPIRLQPLGGSQPAGSASVRAGDPAAELLARIAAGDRAGLRALYDHTAARLFGVALRLTGSRNEAEAVLQAVYGRAMAAAPRLDPARMSGIGWLIAETRRDCLDRLRSRPELPPGETLPETPLEPPASGAARRMARGLAGLKPSEAAALRAAYLDGMGPQALARQFGLPSERLHGWLREAVTALCDGLDRGPAPAAENPGLAAEYVLGTLPGDARLAIAARRAQDRGLAAQIDGLEAMFAALNDGFETVVPPPGLRGRIETALIGQQPPRHLLRIFAALVGGTVVALGILFALMAGS